MSGSTIPDRLPDIQRQPAPQEPQPQYKTYLNHCVEELDMSDIIAKKHDKHATAYKVATYAVIGLFIAAAAAAVILTGIFAPVFVPIAMMSIICLTNPALTLVKQLLNSSLTNEYSAKKTRDLKEAYHAVKSRDTQAEIARLAPGVPQDQQDSLKPLLAHYNYWHGVQQTHEEFMNKKLQEAETPIEQGKENTKVVNYTAVANLRHQALVAKVSKAFIIAVMNNPGFIGIANDICSLKDFRVPANLSDTTTNEWAQHALFRDLGLAHSDDYLVFQNPEVPAISYRETIRATAEELAESFKRAMGLPPLAQEAVAS
jgi:hypothetical protein